jgi:hypothetical protein
LIANNSLGLSIDRKIKEASEIFQDLLTMPYSDFTIDNVRAKLNLELQQTAFIPELHPLTASDWLQQSLAMGMALAIDVDSEKARSEFIIAPVLLELRSLAHSKVSIFSGQDFTIDRELGLSGACDFLIARSPLQLTIEAPVIALVEAKKGILKSGLGQCIAEMVAAQRFNQEQGANIEQIYGIVTTGSIWQFLRLIDRTVTLESKEYSLDPVGKLLAILHWMLQLPPE